jgi:uracil-DNA glycosylase family 4
VPATPEPRAGAGGGQHLFPFLFQQIDVVRPEVIVALGSTAATYLLGVKSSLSGLRGRIHNAGEPSWSLPIIRPICCAIRGRKKKHGKTSSWPWPSWDCPFHPAEQPGPV